jgi:hypothetical protein
MEELTHMKPQLSKRNCTAKIILMICFGLATATSAWCQGTTADILGTVTDPSNSIVAGAKVTIENLATHAIRETTASGDGSFVFSLVPNGHYAVAVTQSGFKTFKVDDLNVSAGDRVRVNATLQIGTTNEIVQVEGVSPALQTDSSSVTQVVTERAVQDLPLNGRNFIQLAQLTPGANEGPTAAYSSGNRVYDRRQTSSVSVNGNSSALNSQMIDGTDNNERLVGTIGVKPAIDAIAEFRVQSNLYTADAGRTAGAVINIITKAGGDRFHGSVYEFFRNDILNSRDYFASGRKPKLRQNQYGGSLGGPIQRGKTFFFTDYEEFHLRQGITTLTTVPTLFEEQNPGNFSDVGGPTVTNLNSIALNYFKLYPAPTTAATANNYLSVQTKSQDSHTGDARVDRTFSQKDQMFVRYTVNNVVTSTPGLLPRVNGIDPGGSLGLFAGTSEQRDQNAQINYIHIFRPNLLMELKTAYTRIYNNALPLNYGSNASNAFGLPGVNLNADTSGLTPMSIPGYASVGDGEFLPLHQLNNTYQYNGAITWTLGNHTLKAGGQFIRRQANNGQATYPIGQFNFSGSGATAMANFLQGNASLAQRSNDLIAQGYRVYEPGGYAQDDWRVSRTVTLNLGVRYDVFTPFTEAKNRLSNFDTSIGKLVVAGVNTNSTVGIRTDYSNVAPRVGFAWSLAKATVMRGGFGITYFPDNFAALAFMRNPPYATAYGPVANVSISNGFPVSSIAPQDPNNPSGSLIGDDKGLRSGSLQQFNLNVQHDFGGNVLTVGYVGELGRQLAEYIYNINAPAPSTATNIAPLRPFYSTVPNVSTINYLQSGGTSSYHSLQTTFERRYRNGLAGTVNYTWAKGINDVLDDSAAGGSYYALLPAQIATYDRSNGDLDQRHRITVAANYELPFGKKSTGFTKAAIAGWQANTIFVWGTDLPVTVVNNTPRINTGVSQDRPNQSGPTSIPHPSVKTAFNTSVFSAQALGTAGNSRRNDVYGPHQRHLDLSLFKTFTPVEALHVEFRAEAFNLTNTPSFSEPNVAFGTGAFGTIASTSIPNRVFQFALKLNF